MELDTSVAMFRTGWLSKTRSKWFQVGLINSAMLCIQKIIKTSRENKISRIEIFVSVLCDVLEIYCSEYFFLGGGGDQCTIGNILTNE